MILLHRNIGSRVIVVPILIALFSFLTSTTAGRGSDVEVDNEQETYQEKEEELRIEL